MRITAITTLVFSTFMSVAIADDAARATAEKVVEMKDGSTLYIFKDKKMAMQDKYGRATRMDPGHVMETKDGRQIIMVGDEVAYLNYLIKKDHSRGGR
jgi:hypothetical protein